jgi:transcriptional regulator with XRE-family HTH domain
MDAPPTPPPEARVLRMARIGRQMSVREAAQRAGVSVSLWRQVEAGYMTPTKGMHAPKIAPAPTLARMAKAVNLSVEDLESEGQRPDAAEILREIIWQRNTDGSIPGHQHAAPTNEPPVPAISLERPPDDFPDMSPEMRPLVAAHVPAIKQLVIDAAIDGPVAAGSVIFRDPDPRYPDEADRWDRLAALGLDPPHLIWFMAVGRVRDDERRAGVPPRRIAAGLAVEPYLVRV